MPNATVTTTGSTPVIPASSLLDATSLVLQNNNEGVDIFVLQGGQVSVSGSETAGIKLKRGGGALTVNSTVGNGGAPRLAVYAVHNGASGAQYPLTWTKYTV